MPVRAKMTQFFAEYHKILKHDYNIEFHLSLEYTK